MATDTLGQFTILTVDDEPLIQKLVREVLSSLGFTNIVVANSGRKALEHTAKTKFDFIITDWRMEDMDGIEIVRGIRSNPKGLNYMTPVIMLTGNTEAYYVKTAISAGVNGYLLKPFSADQLVKRIRAIIETPRDFIASKKYTGPDRRRVSNAPPEGTERRKTRRK